MQLYVQFQILKSASQVKKILKGSAVDNFPNLISQRFEKEGIESWIRPCCLQP